ncbi:MAG: NUDIX hydrolase [Clostridium sp.]|uniref:NUDIX hydrolase n=1 Tax=Clostridium sp. TaxID=1506 RepID=UPI003061697D
MENYPNYRIAVEVIIIHGNKILLTKRADDCVVAPGVWNVPAGKVKYEEIPIEALYREAKEETNLNVELIKELNVRAFKSRSTIEDIYRTVYTYLVKAKNNDLTDFTINEEHSEYAWVTKEELLNERFNSLHKNLKSILLSVSNEYIK